MWGRSSTFWTAASPYGEPTLPYAPPHLPLLHSPCFTPVHYISTVLYLAAQKTDRRLSCWPGDIPFDTLPGVQTRLWLVSQADRLVRERKLLERELNKFTHVTAIQEDHCRHYVRTADDWFRTYHNPTDPKFSSGGKMNLRRLMQEVRAHSGAAPWRVCNCKLICWSEVLWDGGACAALNALLGLALEPVFMEVLRTTIIWKLHCSDVPHQHAIEYVHINAYHTARAQIDSVLCSQRNCAFGWRSSGGACRSTGASCLQRACA